MTREKALAAMDKFVAMGYAVELTERDMGIHGHVFVDPETKEVTSVSRSLAIKELSVDKVDIKAIVQVADDLDLEVGLWPIGGGHLHLTDAPTKEERRKRAVAGRPRAHPR